ncbi:MAG: FliI/YscN family ATPase [Demequina sp.]|uniref:FliI/YscN family ATPase n=1 Tax=Demequina sp. TaxID=2050685 RepID=UPI003A889537
MAAARPQRTGIVTDVLGLSLEVRGLPAAVGDVLSVAMPEGDTLVEVVAVAPRALRCMPLATPHGLRAGLAVTPTGGPLRVPTGPGLLGRVLDGLGRPLDGKGPWGQVDMLPLDSAPPHALERARIDTPLSTGVRVIDTLTPVGRGQRMGLFAGSGVGKSTLLSMMARGTDAEVSVIALIGERGREVREFLEDDLGPEGLARSVVVVATSDEPAMTRLRAAMVATRIAEGFRARGSHAVLMMDSLTRVAMAQREIGLSAGEPPATRGYPPSTFSVLARLLERAGTGPTGSVTGFYTVLVDGDDHNEPIADAARSILDGHIVLTRDLAVAGHYPAIDALASLSRVAGQVTGPDQRAGAQRLRQVLAAHRRARDLIDVGAYAAGSDPLVDAAVTHRAAIDAFLTQRVDDSTPADAAWNSLALLIDQLEGRL